MAKAKPKQKPARGRRKATKGVTAGQRQRLKTLAKEDQQQAGPATDFRTLLIKRAGKDTALVKVITAMSDAMVLGLQAAMVRDGMVPQDAEADPAGSQLYARAWEHLTNPLQRAFLTAFAVNGGFVTQAATAAGIDRRTHVGWMHKDAEYKAAFEEAIEVAADLLEAEADRRARQGLVSYKFDKFGNPLVHPKTGEAYYELSFSDALLIKRLEARRPELYRRKQLEVSGPNGAPLGGFRGDLSALSDAELKAYEALVRKMMAAAGEDK